MSPAPEGPDGETASPTFSRTLVNGVPVLSAPGPGRCVAALMFRVGRADEPAALGGVTHLVEHLTLHGLSDRQSYAFNAVVEPLRVTFYAQGTPEEIVDFLAHVCSAVRTLPLDRIPAEARVLRTEATSRSTNIVETLMRKRYGLRGLGRLSLRELFLDQPDPAQVSSWASTYFTAGNAVAWVHGDVPPDLRLELPPGPRRPAREPETIPGLRFPASLILPPGSPIALSLTGTRTEWLFPVVQVAIQRTTKRMRFEQGVLYSLTLQYDLLSSDAAHLTIVAPVLAAQAQVVRDALLSDLREVAESGPRPEECEAIASQIERGPDTPEEVRGLLDKQAFNELLDYPQHTMADLASQVRTEAGARAGARLRKALDTALLAVPGTVEDTLSGFPPYFVPSEMLTSNTRAHRSSRTPFPWSRNKLELLVGDEGVALRGAGRGYAALLYSELAVASEWPDGALELTDLDGFSIRVHPSEWREGSRAVHRLRKAIPDHLLIRIME